MSYDSDGIWDAEGHFPFVWWMGRSYKSINAGQWSTSIASLSSLENSVIVGLFPTQSCKLLSSKTLRESDNAEESGLFVGSTISDTQKSYHDILAD